MESNFTLSSIRERLALQKLLFNQNDFVVTQLSSIHGYAKWDAVIISGGTEMLLEIKVRDFTSSSYSTWILEEPKHQALMDIKSKKNINGRNMVPFYVNVFRDGVALWDLNQTTPHFNQRKSKKSVMAQDGKKVEKSIAILPLSASTFYSFAVDFDKLNDESEKYFEVIKPGVNYNKLFRNGAR